MSSHPSDFDLIDSVLDRPRRDTLRGHELVTVTGYAKMPSGAMWIEGTSSTEQKVAVRLMSVGEGVEYLMRQPKWQQRGPEYVRSVVQQQFASGKQNQRPTISAFSSSTSPMSVAPGGKILFESTNELGMDGDRLMLSSYWPTMMTRDASSHVYSGQAHVSVHASVSAAAVSVRVHADILDPKRAKMLRPNMDKNEIREAFVDAFRNRGAVDERTNPGLILRLIDANSGQPMRCYDVRSSKTPIQYTDHFTQEAKVRHLSADPVTTLLEIWRGERSHDYMPTIAERDKAILRDDMLRIVLSAVGQSDDMTAKLISPLLSGSGLADAESIFKGIRSGAYQVEVIPYQRVDASKVLRETIRKEMSDAISAHHLAVNAANRAGAVPPKFVNPYDRYVRELMPGVKGEPLFADTHIAVSVMGAGTDTGGVPAMTKFAYADFTPEYLSLNEIPTPALPDLHKAKSQVQVAADAGAQASERPQATTKQLPHRGPELRAEALADTPVGTSIPKPVEDVDRKKKAARMVAAMCREKPAAVARPSSDNESVCP